MAIFPVIETEREVQTDDLTRISAIKTFVSKDESNITQVEIEPESGEGFIDVTGSNNQDWFLDWQYSGSSRTVTITVKVTTDGSPVTKTKDLEILTPTDDGLYSNDNDLLAIEPDLLKWVPEGRNSFTNIHREAQKRIIEHFNQVGIWDNKNKKLTKNAIVDSQEVNDWSRFLTLSIIFNGLSNDVEDIFSVKSSRYASQALDARDRAIIRVDIDGDGSADQGEFQRLDSLDLFRS